MDSTNGHSGKNPKGRKNKKSELSNINDLLAEFGVKLEQVGDVEKISLDDLPLTEREKIIEFMEMMNIEEPPNMYIINLDMHVQDYNLLPTEVLFEFFKKTIEAENYEEAEIIKKVISNKGYSVEFSDNSIIFTENDK